ncbi:agmatinase [Candidatus Microgenomates bacterium]|nr:agmatinase [Candidatus Microgenomates bacterium]
MKSSPISYPATEPFNFAGVDVQNYSSARVAVFPVPYSSTTYWKSTTKEGPRSIIESSRHMELWDEELGKDTSQVGIYTMPELEVSKNSPLETTQRIEKVVASLLKDKKLPLMLGGEHSITLGAVMACAKKYPASQLSVLQLDAHTDSRSEFEGTKYHHGCTMRRVVEDLKASVTHVGIRSTSEEEQSFLKKSKKNHVFYAPACAGRPDIPVEEIIATLAKNVYITIDLDVLDLGIMPAVGTPEPGGIGWYETLNLIKNVAKERNIVGFDIVELAPIPGMEGPNFLAAKLAYKILGYIFS